MAAPRMHGGAAVAIVAASVLLGACRDTAPRSATQTLEVLGSVPPFSLVAADGRPISERDLAGRVSVVNFVFTRCQGICPALSTHMKRVQTALERRGARDVGLVSFSVDPLHDTPAVLQDYAARFGADPTRWRFVTGDRAALYALIQDGFHLAVVPQPEGREPAAGELITHSDRFVLVDPSLQIRGYYHGTDAADVDRLLADIDTLRGGPPS